MSRKNFCILIATILGIVGLTAACQPNLGASDTTAIALTPTSTYPPIITDPLTPISLEIATPALPSDYVDAAYLFDGICYDALRVMVGIPIVLRVQADLDQFFNNLNNLNACDGIITAPIFDFSTQILVGQIQIGQGCDANLYPAPLMIDEQAQTLRIQVQLTVTDDCDYEVMAIFLGALARPPENYAVFITLQP
jgi:hypothetical protein